MSRGLARLPLTAARRWRRPRATLAPERFARLRRLSLAPLTGPCPSYRRRSSLHSGLWFSLFRALLHDSTAARVGALFQLLVQDTTAQDFGLPSSAIRLRM